MPVTIKVKCDDSEVKVRRHATVQRVLDEFGTLPDLRLLIFLDDTDWHHFKRELEVTNRGFHIRLTGYNLTFEIWPPYLIDLLFAIQPSFRRKRLFDNAIYLYESTCADEDALTMTLAHELQHFVQYGFYRRIWALNYLLSNLPREVFKSEGLNWPDIPIEREARAKAKQVAVKLRGEDVVKRYIDRRIAENASPSDVDDWSFVKRLDPSIPYDLEDATRRMFIRTKGYQHHFQDVLNENKKDKVFQDIRLSEYLNGRE